MWERPSGWLPLPRRLPLKTTIVPSNTVFDYYDGWTYEDGAFRFAFYPELADGNNCQPPQPRTVESREAKCIAPWKKVKI